MPYFNPVFISNLNSSTLLTKGERCVNLTPFTLVAECFGYQLYVKCLPRNDFNGNAVIFFPELALNNVETNILNLINLEFY